MSLADLLSSPNEDAELLIKADWLELAAVLSNDHEARLTVYSSQLEMQVEADESDIAENDAETETEVVTVAVEIERRGDILGDAYPFRMSVDGRKLEYRYENNFGQDVYLFSLFVSHARASELVGYPLQPTDARLLEARDIFQICSTLAAAGRFRGPAFSVGWPRPDKTRFLDKVKEVWAIFGDGVPHVNVPADVPPALKDGGIDIIAWHPEPDARPGEGYYLGQVASGNLWEDKSVFPDLAAFRDTWFSVQPASPARAAMFIPKILSEMEHRWEAKRQGLILDRHRMPTYAAAAFDVAAAGIGPIERIDEYGAVRQWLNDYERELPRATK